MTPVILIVEIIPSVPPSCAQSQRVPTVKNGFKQGMKLEGIDPQHPSMYFVLTVAEVSRASVATIHGCFSSELASQVTALDRYFLPWSSRCAAIGCDSTLTATRTVTTSGWTPTPQTSTPQAGVKAQDTNCTRRKVRGHTRLKTTKWRIALLLYLVLLDYLKWVLWH